MNERYSRQTLLKNLGETGQQKLLQAKVLVVGAGGLGCPVLQYLAAAGIGTLGIVDGDIVSLSNLQRQVLYTSAEIGQYKTSVAAARLRQMNPEIRVNEHLLFVDTRNALHLFEQYDIIVDGTDNFATRYLINDACVLLNKPLVFGAVYQYAGQVAIFNVADQESVKINYRHLFPVPPSAQEAPDCATAGVLGTLPGIIGMMQATEAIKLITGIGEPLINKMVTYNALNNDLMTVDLSAAFALPITMPENEHEFKQMNYEIFCNSSSNTVEQIDAAKFRQFLQDENLAIIDVREPGEKPLATFRHIQLPMSAFKENMDQIPAGDVVIFCQSGKRSLIAGELLVAHFNDRRRIYNLKNGILSLG